MNKKFLIVALMAALSTVGYGAWNENLQIENLPLSQSADKDKTMENFNELKEQLQSNKNNLDTLNKFQEVTSGQVGDLTQEVESVKGDVDFVKGEVERVEGEVTDLQNKVETGFEDLQNQVSGNSQALGELGQDVVDLNKDVADLNAKSDANDLALENAIKSEAMNRENQDKVLNNKIEENKKAQAETDKKQDQALKDETTAREEADKKLQGQINDFNDKFAGYDGRLSGLEKKVDHLDDKMNKGLSLMAAMNAVDFQNVQTGEMAIGAGIGHYGNAQSVALGVAYAPVEDLTVNAKYSITAGDPDSFAVGAGATYKFKVGR